MSLTDDQAEVWHRDGCGCSRCWDDDTSDDDGAMDIIPFGPY